MTSAPIAAISRSVTPGYDDKYPNWRNWWLVGKFKTAYPHDIPTPGHLQSMAAIVGGLGSPWNIPTNWQRCKWYHNAKGAISLCYGNDLCTFDSARLTDLVIAAHAHSVRVEIAPCSPQYLRIIFWPREHDAQCGMTRHPTLAELIKRAEAA